MIQRGIVRVGQVFHAEEFFRFGDTGCGERDGTAFFIYNIVAVVVVLHLFFIGLGKDQLPQAGDEKVRHFIELGGCLAFAGDDQRRPGLVDEDGVHLVHNGEAVSPLDQLFFINGHVVPQVIKAQFIVGAVGNIGGVGGFPLRRRHTGNHQPHG